jgi:hypothetical protein
MNRVRLRKIAKSLVDGAQFTWTCSRLSGHVTERPVADLLPTFCMIKDVELSRERQPDGASF